jgi:CRISPR-associated protein Cst2
MNLFATVLTHAAPSANYRGESELNRTVIQKITDGRFEYPIVSPEAMRNALREILGGPRFGLPMNRARMHPTAGEGDEKQQLAVRYAKLPNPEGFADDFLFGYLLAVKDKELARIRKEKGSKYPLKRDSVLRMNLAKGLEPYRHATVFTQSPKFAEGNAWKVGGEGGTSSALLHRETADTAFQYPFALNGEDCRCTSKECDHAEPSRSDAGNTEMEHQNILRASCKQRWVGKLLKAIGELANVAGNHARSLFFMAPSSIVVRLTERLCPGYDQYHFRVRRDPATNERIYESKVIEMLLADSPVLPLGEFYVGGEIVDALSKKDRTKLEANGKGVKLDSDPSALLDTVAEQLFQAES